MTTIPATTFSQQLFERGTGRRNSGLNRGLALAAALLPRGGNCRIVDRCSRGTEHFRDWLVVRDRPLSR
jgi:hypothetical protein